MIRESISKMKNRKAAGPSGLVSEMVKAVGEAGVSINTSLVNQIIVDRYSSSMRTLHYCELLQGNRRCLMTLADEILEIAEKIIERLIRRK